MHVYTKIRTCKPYRFKRSGNIFFLFFLNTGLSIRGRFDSQLLREFRIPVEIRLNIDRQRPLGQMNSSDIVRISSCNSVPIQLTPSRYNSTQTSDGCPGVQHIDQSGIPRTCRVLSASPRAPRSDLTLR